MGFVWLDGKLVEESEAKISVFDHGLLYGDGVFEGIRLYSGRVFRLKEHLERLELSARAIALKLRWSQQEISEAVIDTIRANNLHDGYVRLVVTRGSGNLGLNPNLCKVPTLFIIASTVTLYPEEKYREGLNLITCATRRPAPAALSPQVKSLNYLNNIMGKIEALQAGASEGLMLNEAGYVAECTGDNIFIVKSGTLYTPPISDGALNGITRQVIMELARKMKIPTIEQSLTRYDIFTADECFLSGTAAEVISVVNLDQRVIGDGKPGSYTKKLTDAYHELTQQSGVSIK